MDAIKMKFGGVLLACVVALAAVADRVLPIEVVSGSRPYTVEELAAIRDASDPVTIIRKIGSGTLVSSGIASYAGAIEVEVGTLEVQDGTGLGTTAGRTSVASGATLKLNASSSRAIWQSYQNEPITLSGSDAVDSISVSTDSVFLDALILEGNASIKSDVTLYLGTASGKTIDMGGNTLTIKGPASGNFDLYFGFQTVLNPGHLTVDGFRFFYESAALTGGATHVLTLTGRPSIRFVGLDNGSDWTLRMNGTGGVYAESGKNVWEGPVELGSSTRTFVIMSQGDLQLRGPVSGSAAMTLGAGSEGSRLSLFGDNSFTGTLTLQAGSVYLASAQAVPSLTAATPQFAANSNGDSLILEPESDTHPEGWTPEEIWTYIGTFRAFGRVRPYFKVSVPEGETLVHAKDFDGINYSLQSFGALGGAYRMRGHFLNQPRFQFLSAGTVTLSAPENDLGCEQSLGVCYLAGGTLNLLDFGFLHLADQDFYMNGTADSPARLVIGSGTTIDQRLTQTQTSQIEVTHVANGRGTLEIASGAVVTNKVRVGIEAGRSGVVRIRGGELYNTGRLGNVGTFGGAGQAAVEVTSGQLVLKGHTQLGASAGGVGELRQSGGVVTVESEQLAVGMGGAGSVYQTGGMFSSKVSLPVCGPGTDTETDGGEGCVTFAGSSRATVLQSVSLAGRNNGLATLNVNGDAVLETPWITRATTVAGNAAYVNFNGGTVRTTGSQIYVLGTGGSCPTRTTVYAGGVTFDVGKTSTGANQEIWISTPLQKPDGKGLVGPIAVPNAPLGGYLTPPRVVVTGDGTGATAVADFDFDKGQVTGVTVTSPGWGYEAATVTLKGEGTRPDVSWSVTPAADAGTGGLTKRGAGLLRLAAENTYAGATVIEGGTVRLGCDWALPKGSELVLRNGAQLAFNGKTAEVSRVTYGIGGGSLVEGSKAVIEKAEPDFIVSVDELRDGRSLAWMGDIDLSASTLTITGDLSRVAEGTATRYQVLSVSNGSATGEPEIVSGALPKGWKFSVRRNGVRLVKEMGMMLIFR